MEQQTALLEALSDALARVEALGAQLQTEREADAALVVADGQLWATGEQLARRYAVSREWVLTRPRQLGAAPISDSANSKLRYHLPTADAYMEGRMQRPQRRASRASRARRPGAHRRSAVPQLDFV